MEQKAAGGASASPALSGETSNKRTTLPWDGECGAHRSSALRLSGQQSFGQAMALFVEQACIDGKLSA